MSYQDVSFLRQDSVLEAVAALPDSHMYSRFSTLSASSVLSGLGSTVPLSACRSRESAWGAYDSTACRSM